MIQRILQGSVSSAQFGMIFIFLFCLSHGTVVQSLLPFACEMGRAWHVSIVNCLYQELSSLQSWMLEQGAPSSDFGHFKIYQNIVGH